VTIGYFEGVGYFLGISRTIYFFPFFILGYRLKQSPHFFALLQKAPKILFIFIILANISLFYFISDFPYQWLYGSFSYEKLGVDFLSAGSTRLMLYGVSIVSSISLLMLFSRDENMLSIRGSNSLFVYVWHGFFIKFLLGIGVFSLLKSVPPLLALILLLILACLLSWFLSVNLIAHYSEKLIIQPLKRLLLR
jgi:fucose 4-O-acetylase-like acetyltransferase